MGIIITLKNFTLFSFCFQAWILLFNIMSTTTVTSQTLTSNSSQDVPCNLVNCGKGTCVASNSSVLGFDCVCNYGWKKMQLGPVTLPPCLVPNCTLDFDCGNGAPPPQLPSTLINLSNPCALVWCGDGSCAVNGTSYYCQCNDGSANLLNATYMPCFKQCSFGADCKGLNFGPGQTLLPPSPGSSTPSGGAYQDSLGYDFNFSKSHPTVQFNHEHQLELKSLQELPESHSWNTSSSQDGYIYHEYCNEDEKVPAVIDLNDPNAQILVGKASKTWGIIQVTNHGIPTALLEKFESEMRELFSLPMEQKLKAARSSDGIHGYGLHKFSRFFPKLMWSEGFTIVGSPDIEQARQLWPHDYGRFCEVMNEYIEEMQKLAAKMVWLVLGSLGITHQDIKWAGPKGDFEGASGILQLNSYPPCPDPEKAMGLAPHADSSLVTIVHQTNSGLQVLREGNRWAMVPLCPGALVVFIGDLLHMLTNGLYPSPLHRVMVNRTQPRLSAAYLYGPHASVEISPLPKLVNQGDFPMYKPVTWKGYLDIKAKHFHNVLSVLQTSLPLNGFVETNENCGVQVKI